MGVSGRNMKLLLLGLLLCVELGCPTANDNHHAFEVLCGLYNLAQTPVKLPEVDTTGKIRNDLIKLNMTTADDDWYNLFSGKNPTNWNEEKDKDPFKEWVKVGSAAEWEQSYKDWVEAKKDLGDDAQGAKEYLRPPATRQREIAHFRIRRLWQRFLEEESERKNLGGDLKKLGDEIGKKFNTARFGAEDATAATKEVSFDGSGSNARSGNACGNNGNNGNKATGTSLANDLVCICTVTGTPGNANNICVTGYTHSGNVWDSDATTAASEFPNIVKHCPKPAETFSVTAGAIKGNLTKFWGAVGRHGGSPAADSIYVLGGGAVSSGNCVGGTAAQMCVNYKTNFRDGSAVPKGIPWLNALESAATLLDELDASKKKIHALNARAESLRDAAWAAYDQARFVQEDGTPAPTDETAAKAEKPATAVPGDGGKAEERSGATIQRLILPWTLLI